MAKVKYETNLSGLNELMKSPEMVSALEEAGKAVMNSAGGTGYEMDTITRSYIAITRVKAESEKAVRDCLKDNALLKAVGAVGLRMTK